MKILYYHRTLGDGAEGIHIAEMINSFAVLGHRMRVVSLIGNSTNTPSPDQRRWSYIKSLMPGFLYEFGEIAYNLSGYAHISQAIKDFRPDFIYCRYASYDYSAIAAGRRYGIPLVLEVNSPYSYQRQTFDERLYFKNLLRFFERKTCQGATYVLCVSSPLKKYLISIGVPSERIVVMPNGVDPAAFNPDIDGGGVRRQYNIENNIVIGFTGILRPWHGIDLLMKAFAKVAAGREDLHLLIVGDGPIRGELETLASNLGIAGNMTITGRLAHDNVRFFVAAMDIAVSPRATFYSSPMKILEYMGMGKAVVAPDMENIRDLLSHGSDGILFREEM